MSSPTLEDGSRTLSSSLLSHLQSWAGKTETRADVITVAPQRGLGATLDRDDAEPVPGTVLPPLWHWLYFLPQPRQSEIGPDGHAKRGGFLPPVPLPRRMWAAGRLTWLADNPLRVGDAVQRNSRIDSVTHKTGRSGDLLFVRVKHEVHNTKGLALTEEHDIVYRAAAQTGDPAPAPVPAEPGAAWQREVVADAVLLFRYSALTFNGHRIHYDRQYATQVEGYPGLIVHGPLIATLLIDLVRRQAPDAFVAGFSFKLLRPTFDRQPLRLSGQPSADGKTIRLWAQNHDACLTMMGTAELA